MRISLITFATLWTVINTQKFRMDYMWAHAFKTFYRLHDLATNWQQARQICEAEGTSLLVPGSLEEMENLKLLISNMKAHYTAIFIGIHDQFSEGDFVTIKGEPITGTILELLWADGRPDNANDTEDCVVMTREGLFDDRPCYDIHPFVCKILGNESRFNDKCQGYDMGYVLHENGKCYKFHSEPLSWHDAYHVCMLEEGRLCVINSAEEASLVVSMLGEHLNNNAPDSHILHIGFTDLMFPFQYRTITGETLEEAGYSSWSPLQEGLRKLGNNRCGALSRTGFLKTTSCLHPAMFLCEKSNNSISRFVINLPLESPLRVDSVCTPSYLSHQLTYLFLTKVAKDTTVIMYLSDDAMFNCDADYEHQLNEINKRDVHVALISPLLSNAD